MEGKDTTQTTTDNLEQKAAATVSKDSKREQKAARRAMRRRSAKTKFLVFFVLVLLVMAGLFGAWVTDFLNDRKTELVSPAVDGNSVVSDREADLASLVKNVSPSVVSVVTTQSSGVGYFSQQSEGAGTGMIISSDGYVLTNKHVVSGARSINIIDSDGERYKDVKVIGSDPFNDIAFLKINGAKDLPVITLGDSGTVRVGQDVIAIGNSLGQYQNTVTRGIVSGLGRPAVAASDASGANAESLTDLLQTDAAINPGNSGGPLINMAGQVVGINTAIVSDAQSMGFAIPINAAKGLARGVIKDGEIKKAYLGVQYMAITPEVRAEFDLSKKHGAYVRAGGTGSAVVKDGPADKAGIRDGDIIDKVNDKEVGIHGGLGSLVSEFLPGEEVTIELTRDGQSRKVKMTLGNYQSER